MNAFKGARDFGNGRFAERVLQYAETKHARRLGEAAVAGGTAADAATGAAGDTVAGADTGAAGGTAAGEPGDDFAVLTTEDIPTVQEMIDRNPAGSEMTNPALRSDEVRRITAIHEAGHAVCQMVAGHGALDGISITGSVAGTGGVTMINPDAANTATDTAYMFGMLTTLFGGMAAEEVMYSTHTTGCMSDLKRARELSKQMVEEFAMPSLDYDPNALLKEANAYAAAVCEANEAAIAVLAEILLKKETITRDETAAFFERADLDMIANPYAA